MSLLLSLCGFPPLSFSLVVLPIRAKATRDLNRRKTKKKSRKIWWKKKKKRKKLSYLFNRILKGFLFVCVWGFVLLGPFRSGRTVLPNNRRIWPSYSGPAATDADCCCCCCCWKKKSWQRTLLCDSEIRRPQEKKNKSSKENSYVDRLWWPLRFFSRLS